MNGEIVRVVADKGFGFIRGQDGVERFFHRSAVESSVNFNSLATGQRVSFEDEPSPKGPRARRVSLAS
jgi:CspA family cold shock protein